jgi:hypothetical protein
VRAVLRKGAVVKTHKVGLHCFGAHGVIIRSATIVGKPRAVPLRESKPRFLVDDCVDSLSAAEDVG